MRIIYLANMRMPTERAHGIQVVKTCEAFARAGVAVELVVPTRRNSLTEDPFAYYGVEKNFTVTYVSAPDTVGWGRFGFVFQSCMFARRTKKLLRQKKFEVLYGRDEIPLALLLWRGARNVVWESHTGAWNLFARAVGHRAERIIVISQGLKDFYVEHGVPANKILVAHDGIDLRDFANPQSQEQSRARLGLPASPSLGGQADKKIALYVGGLGGWKGTDTLGQAAALLPDICVAVVGGTEAEVAEARQTYPAVLFVGARPYQELADNLAAADVLVLPNTGRSDVSRYFTSPLKLFAYMSSGRPIVASDLPSIREVLDEQSAVLVAPDDPQALAAGIKKILNDEPLANNQAANALHKVQEYTWEKRAKKILDFIQR